MTKQFSFSVLRFLAFFIIALFCCRASSQPIGVHLHKVKDKRLTMVLSMLDTTITRSDDTMSVTLYKIYNQFGSAHIPETDEVSVKYLVSMGQDKGSEMPDDHLFSLGNFYGPKLIQFKKNGKNSFLILIEHGFFNHRSIAKFLVKRTNVVALK